uniref:Gypsy retrotransposon integrase-like protein 1 n=1 Tax=Gasterosteus aculeatus aculeatus TaxID=481459 RepID=A0AAQ4RE84_GASAC
MILGNDLAGGAVWPSVPPSPVVAPELMVIAGPDDCGQRYPDVFPACAVTRAQRAKTVSDIGGEQSETKVVIPLPDLPPSVPRLEWVESQQVDPSLSGLLTNVLPESEVGNVALGYFLQDGLLVRKWVPRKGDFVGEPVFQIVVPDTFRVAVLKIAHDESGHLGPRKTYDRILRYFFWPKLKRDVSNYIKSCHTCQLTGKPSQSIKTAPLCPIPAISQPFEHLIIDCVGPLPTSKSGCSYLLSVMCQTTRYPAVYPLRSISARSIVKALTQFFSIFGVPRVIQSDQGSNFTLHLFGQVLKQLKVKHNRASAYHAQSQGASERFHQTLKSLLRACCTEVGRDWEEGLPWLMLMLSAREVVQGSTGFSPNDLVFGHTVRGPLAVLRDGLGDTVNSLNCSGMG